MSMLKQGSCYLMRMVLNERAVVMEASISLHLFWKQLRGITGYWRLNLSNLSRHLVNPSSILMQVRYLDWFRINRRIHLRDDIKHTACHVCNLFCMIVAWVWQTSYYHVCISNCFHLKMYADWLKERAKKSLDCKEFFSTIDFSSFNTNKGIQFMILEYA